jgi:hypothetical protein
MLGHDLDDGFVGDVALDLEGSDVVAVRELRARDTAT